MNRVAPGQEIHRIFRSESPFSGYTTTELEKSGVDF